MKTKTKIIEAALQLAAKQGIEKTSMSQIADAVGIQKPSLYHYYRSKSDLFQDVYSSFRNQPQIKPSSIDWSQSMTEIVKGTITNYIDISLNGKIALLFKIIENEKFLSPSAASLYQEETQRMIRASTALFKMAEKEKNLTFKEIDHLGVIYALLAHEIVLNSIISGKNVFEEYRATFDSLFDLFIQQKGVQK